MKKTVYYSDNIRYEDENGNIKEYKPALVKADEDDKNKISKSKVITKTESEDYLYTNNQGDTKQYIPEKIDEDTPLLMTNENYRVSFAPVSEGENVKKSAFSGETDKVSIEKDTIVTSTEEEKDAKVNAVYSDEESNIDLLYQSMEHGVKEDIILNEKPETNVFAFQMTLENMWAKLDDVGGGITFFGDEEDEIIGGIAAPFMNDATEKAYSEDVYFELEQLKSEKENVNRYLLKVVADEKYLSDSRRQYPVTIDPSVTWSGVTNLPDVYVLNSKPSTNYFSSGVKTFSVGKGSQGLFRSYIRAMKLSDTVKGKYVESATLTLYENGANTKNVTIQVKPVKKEFKCKNVTWENKPNGTNDVLATITSSGTSGAKKTVNLTQWARNVARGAGAGEMNYGLLLMAKDESTSSYVKFYGVRSDATAKRPKLTVTYYDGPTTPSSVSTASSADSNRNHLKSGEDLKVSWAGINSKVLDYVQYRVANYDEDANACTTNYVSYSSSTKIGTISSGTKTLASSSDWKEGHYKIFVRGVDEGGITGAAAGAHFIIDRTAPVIMDSYLESDYEDGEYSDELPTLTKKL